MDITEVTGLPELPDGMFYRVRELKDRDYAFTFVRPNGFILSIMSKSVTKLTRPKYVSILGRNFKTGIEEFYQETFTDEVTVSIKVPDPDDTLQTFDGSPVEGLNVVREARVEELNSELILKHAIKAYELLQRKIFGRQFVGDYPPKTLKGN